jgi:coenzyme F420-dependent glucose-6-phosphate dehydrogenase
MKIMMTIAYHASHEQFAPSDLLYYVQLAKQAGFTAITCSDHLVPWYPQQNNSGSCWPWLGAAMQACQLPFSAVTTPGYRYHPVILAQMIATIDEMFPGRFTIAMGDGEALNETIVNVGWPNKEERMTRLELCIDIMRRLWRGETVTQQGALSVNHAKLYTVPNTLIPIFGAPLGEKTAQWLGKKVDGLITISQSLEKLRKIIQPFIYNGGEGKPLHLKVQVSYANTKDKARQLAWQEWRNAGIKESSLNDIGTPEEVEAAGANVSEDDVAREVICVAHLKDVIPYLEDYINLGFSLISLHNVNKEQVHFIQDFGKLILPHFRDLMK